MKGEGEGEWTRRIRASVAGFALGGAGFLSLGLYLNLATDFPPLANAGPVGVLALIGATVGGLVGPLAAGLFSRSRGGQDGD